MPRKRDEGGDKPKNDLARRRRNKRLVQEEFDRHRDDLAKDPNRDKKDGK